LKTDRRSDIEVRLQAVAAALAAEARLLVAAERRGRVELVERVGPDDARTELVRDGEDPRTLLRPDPRRQAVRGVVGLGDRLVRGAEAEDGQHGAEDLVAGDPVRLG